ncbi:hypothetical protein EST38_g2233 [Candolleomyces aberdarensis]|uniref:Uncharacterized protein n=1 Tax=Candolleomyces aberdarensis TaxID=2316362 RepID=A0A4Q2DV68_9AGAR|nr:hypothetical protein EST38_g2233 [Candolleomyces aberdarensis]
MPAHVKGRLLGAMFSLTLCSVAIVMFIMVYITFREYYQNFSCSLLTVFYRDGLFYFFSLSALAAVNIIVNFTAPEGGYQFLAVQ